MLLPMMLLTRVLGVVPPSHARTTPIKIASMAPFVIGKAAVDAFTLLLIMLIRRWDVALLLGLSTLNRWLSPLNRILVWHTLEYR